ncbi:anaerobic sulfite reductase subunit AsrB [Clostridium gasigenes]|uniref:Anaerobic sulfite reductase subunit B n=1 Tax=Clostridium gasigenes TaxID=94869 RepID=A0A1H0UKK2_9CLOT|nr:anaerobic sulfite reductase subunit AsrB [Clostridium gasigenes]MBB6623167.1 anaerobic sulfite reductase subunit B [Clostridium gasigenes]MBU3087933.1 anaerobic sulfite reductase subunit AsrB [Clostridium gasigenes]MBU3107388.1 anaerobic sulfite reductase subunit AsrB [Clostridium gasigenes]MBU3135429.1 anaerobic sulfite reductase subunit AsrB [Clostridium gasigenes]NKF05823.1 anaerobic sulfite reductase subunit B [Clostridium gasigenes]
MKNEYIPFISKILEVIKHTEIEYTFRMAFKGEVKPGQFFEVSIPKYGEAPISVSGIGVDYVDLTIRKVGVVTDEIFNNYVGDKLFLRGPYGNGFDIENYKNKEVIVVAGGTGLSPVKGIVDYFSANQSDATTCTLIAGFKSPVDILFKEDMKCWEKNINLIVSVDGAEEGYTGKVGLVTKYVPELEIKDIDTVQVVVVGPPMMMKFTVLEFLKLGIKEENIWISQERKMCCGLGKCGHCRIDDTYICLDGPVFNYSIGKSLID